jgi:primosomal protein N' (replication factor Y)
VFAKVAIPKSAPHALTYSVPDDLAPFTVPGVRARVPLRKKTVTGVVVEVADESELDPKTVRSLIEIVDSEPLLPPHLFHLADFVSSYYRSPLGDTLATILPAGLLRSDGEIARLTPAGAASDPETLPGKRGAVLSELQAAPKLRLPTLFARAGVAGRGPLDALVEAGLATVSVRRRDRSPEAEVAAIWLPEIPVEQLLEKCQRAPRRREVLEWLAEQGRPALVSEVCEEVGCSPSTLRAMDAAGLVLRFKQAAPRRPRWVLRPEGERHRLTDEQQEVVDAVGEALAEKQYAPFLLEGITGSGKTEVYLRCLEDVLARGRSGLVLVPEIGLTPAASGAIERRFGSQTAVLHSALSEGERWREWQRIRDGRAKIVVGPRSALFAPFSDLGLIVVDEEHDAAYKQQEAPRYHARDLSLVTAQHLAVPVILCSATPSVEASALVERDLATHLRLTRRVAGGQLPEVELVDLRGEPAEPGEHGRTLFSRRLRELLTETVDRGEQVILLMQRRGWAPILLCRDCGHRIQCPSCSVSLVVHRRSGDLRCHYCDHRAATPPSCPSCSGDLLDAVGAGTEKVAHHLETFLPGVKSAILDRDTVRRRSGLQDTLGAFAAGTGRQGPPLPQRHTDRRHLGRRHARSARLPGRRTHLPTPDPARGTIRPRRPAGQGRDSDLLPGTPRRPSRMPARRHHLPQRRARLQTQLRLSASDPPRARAIRGHGCRAVPKGCGSCRGSGVTTARESAPERTRTGAAGADPQALALADPSDCGQPRAPARMSAKD